MECEASSLKSKIQKASVASGQPIPKFLLKTFDLLESGESSEFISWNEAGTAIVIKNPDQFASQVLPKLFQHGKLCSFIRQLNMYDFSKMKSSGGVLIYNHPYFQRNRRDTLVKVIRRTNSSHPFKNDFLFESSSTRKENEMSNGVECNSSRNDLFYNLIIQNENLKAKIQEAKKALHEMQLRMIQAQRTKEKLLSYYRTTQTGITNLEKMAIIRQFGANPNILASVNSKIEDSLSRTPLNTQEVCKNEFPYKRVHCEQMNLVLGKDQELDDFIDYFQGQLAESDNQVFDVPR